MPSNNIQLQYSQIDTVATQLNNAVTNINPQLLQLQGTVENLLGDGLFLQQTSPAMQHAYQQFTGQLTNIVAKIEDFAKQFTSIKTQIDDMDRTMKAQIEGAGGK
ncbi:WXG100 family type VII secretion target [Streptomyces sp. V4-01]|uniref:WXG100 family type VII secretion target n=1 Tax=Actinacidiphila polyblastidii TaxID=3110430 RepID=A0ABU7PCW2_9ACTN|nr:WXG100 family type VII secretion target [Streptomyces sp. V4-01]